MWSRSLALALLPATRPGLRVKENVAARAPQGAVLSGLSMSCYRRLTESKSNCDSDFLPIHGRLMCRRRNNEQTSAAHLS
jgi:hypothetical protein